MAATLHRNKPFSRLIPSHLVLHGPECWSAIAFVNNEDKHALRFTRRRGTPVVRDVQYWSYGSAIVEEKRIKIETKTARKPACKDARIAEREQRPTGRVVLSPEPDEPEQMPREEFEDVMYSLRPGKMWDEMFSEEGVVRSIEKVGSDGFTQYAVPSTALIDL